uniref:Uncharacterized protein n=1 Tax=Pararge aegeria TaxID=116150 RepID=S4P2A5_9NEOP
MLLILTCQKFHNYSDVMPRSLIKPQVNICHVHISFDKLHYLCVYSRHPVRVSSKNMLPFLTRNTYSMIILLICHLI